MREAAKIKNIKCAMDYAIEFQIHLIVCVVGLERKQENRTTSKQCDNKEKYAISTKTERMEGRQRRNERNYSTCWHFFRIL